MNRRESLSMLSAMLAVGTMSVSAAAETARKPPPFDVVLEPAADLAQQLQVCLSHCFYLISEGKSSAAELARSANETLVLVQSVNSLAIQHGRQLSALVPLAMASVQLTDTECSKWRDQPQIARCSQACQAFLKAGKQFQSEYAEFEKTSPATRG